MQKSDLIQMTFEQEISDKCTTKIKDVESPVKPELPKILYKYRTWNKELHRKILKENKLYFASPKCFEDELDCKGLESFPPQNKLFEFFYELSKQKGMEMTDLQRCRFATYWSQNSPLANPEELKKLIEYYDNQFYNLYGVCSLTEDPNNQHMWNKYSDNYKGICIGFDAEKLIEIAGEGGPVIYTPHKPLINFMQDFNVIEHFKRVYCKEQKWSFEKEYRLAKMWGTKPSDEDRNIPMLSDTIVKVILGYSISENNKKEIVTFIEQKYPKVEIMQL